MNTTHAARRLAVATLLVGALSGLVATQVEHGPVRTAARPEAPLLSSDYARLPQLPEVVVTARRTGA